MVTIGAISIPAVFDRSQLHVKQVSHLPAAVGVVADAVKRRWSSRIREALTGSLDNFGHAKQTTCYEGAPRAAISSRFH
jgi:hypothetical protein